MQEIRRAGYILIGIMALAMTCSFVWRPAPPARFHGLAALGVPLNVGPYQGHDVPIDALTKNSLTSAEILCRDYTGPIGPINLTVIGGTNRDALHDPRSCLVGAGWKLSDDRTEALPDNPNVRMRTCTAELNQNGQSNSIDILYLYVTHGRVISSATEIRAALLEAAIFDQSDAPVYYFRMYTHRPSGSQNDTEHTQLVSFAQDLWDKVGTNVLDGGHK